MTYLETKAPVLMKSIGAFINKVEIRKERFGYPDRFGRNKHIE